jgi:hypothetical protein
VDKTFSKQLLRNNLGVAVVEVARELLHNGRLAQFPV